jgi:hypothetical protein
MKRGRVVLFGVVAVALLALGATRLGGTASATAASCQLTAQKGNIKHVIYIQFDNTHFRRDNPNVPSDLEQMPHLLNFIKSNGTLLANDHTALISHTATGILTSLTGVYPDRMGQPVSNSFRYFTPSGTSRTGVAFAYWTAPLYDPAGPPFPPAGQTDLTPEMINENGKIAPAPWVPYTRAGCDVGAVATANTILENTGIDVPTFFGSGSPEAIQANSDSPGASATQSFADFVGIGIHCAQGSAICAGSAHSHQDVLPDEPGGYSGFDALMGAKYVNRVIKPSGPMTDLDGYTIQDQNGHVGFPGFDGMTATVSLSYVAQMQEAGVPVTYAYISDAHDGHGTSGNTHYAYGPGESGYVAQLTDYDIAFQKFFDRLKADNISKSNTLFVFTVDEGDHFAGDSPTPSNCDGVTTACTYNRVGEINADLRRMIYTQFGDSTLFSVHSDDAPTVYVNGNPPRTDAAVRNLERESALLDWTNPYTGSVETHGANGITRALADPVEEKSLHMVTADPNRTPTFTLFADPDWFFFATGGVPPTAGSCATPAACASIPARTSQSFAWNHGDIQDEIASTWAGFVGPGVNPTGVDTSTWSDHTDLRPTMLTLLGLKDDYTVDGRLLAGKLTNGATPSAVKKSSKFEDLAAVYKQLNAPFGSFDMDTLTASTKALASNDAGDATYNSIEGQIESLTTQRDSLAGQIKSDLANAEFNGQVISDQDATNMIDQANSLIAQAHTLATS